MQAEREQFLAALETRRRQLVDDISKIGQAIAIIETLPNDVPAQPFAAVKRRYHRRKKK